LGINTEEIVKTSLKLANWVRLPADSNIHVSGDNIHKVLIAIDVGVAELILAKNLGCDGVIAHHPIGISSLNFHKVFDRHLEYMTKNGIPKDLAKEATRRLEMRVSTRSHAAIYDQVVHAAKLLKMPLVNIHQPCDEVMRRTILDRIMAESIEYVSDIIKSIETIGEFKNVETRVETVFGSSSNRVGRWALVVAAGTNGGYPIAKLYFQHGIDTVIYLHIDYGDILKLQEEQLRGNLVIMGHLAGDSIGLNALADKLEEQGIETVRLGIIPSI
jgi:putative NIF3 family GTP cyclohydrolase 1 type 2